MFVGDLLTLKRGGLGSGKMGRTIIPFFPFGDA